MKMILSDEGCEFKIASAVRIQSLVSFGRHRSLGGSTWHLSILPCSRFRPLTIWNRRSDLRM